MLGDGRIGTVPEARAAAGEQSWEEASDCLLCRARVGTASRRSMEQEWLPALTAREVVDWSTGEILAWVEKAGGGAQFAFEEFLYGQIRNPFTRRAYLRAVRRFAKWCADCGLDLVRVTPADGHPAWRRRYLTSRNPPLHQPPPQAPKVRRTASRQRTSRHIATPIPTSTCSNPHLTPFLGTTGTDALSAVFSPFHKSCC
jgi:hypothetical protein